MYNPQKIRTAFTSLVGILQPDIMGTYPVLPPLSISNTGIMVQDKHPLVSTQNLFYAAPDFNINNYTQANIHGSYTVGQVISYSQLLYICISPVSLNGNPPSVGQYFSLYNPFQSWLQQKYNQAITNLFAEVVKRKKLNMMGKELLERQQLYRGGGQRTRTIISDGSFVGYEITPQSAEGLLVFLDMVGIQSTQSQEEMTYYLYHNTVDDPLNTWVVPIDNANTFSWTNLQDSQSVLNCVLKYLEQNTSGVYYFGYYQDDLVGQAVSKDWDCSTAPCYGCDGGNTAAYNLWSQYTTFRNIKVPATALNSEKTLWNTDQIIYNTVTNWGINLSITVRCDLTDTIIYSKNLFADAFAMQLTKEFLDAIARSSRINPTNTEIQLQARADLDRKFKGAWILEYDNTVDALNIDLSGFSKACMPCDNVKKMKWSTI